MAIYKIRNEYWEDSFEVLVEGPECNFNDLCRDLIPFAIDRAVEKYKNDYIGCRQVVDCLLHFLFDKDFKLVTPFQTFEICLPDFIGGSVNTSNYSKGITKDQVIKVDKHNTNTVFIRQFDNKIR